MLSISPTYMLYYVPLLVSVSLVFAATRHEDTGLIIQHALYTARWITGFMLTILAVLLFLSWMI